MRTLLIIISLFFVCSSIRAQIENISTKYDLPNTISETSGLLFFDGKLITHNDSGNSANLYELDTISGSITRTISITNATNVDWEDITQDETYIYIGDFGNNNGNRQDLKIYRVLKADFTNNTNVDAETISFNYEDQSDFSSKPNNNNFDAEAISIYKNQLIIFTKNWIDNTVNAYSIPKSIGNHIAKKVSTYNSSGLITGATYNKDDESFLLCGYTTLAVPFLIYVDTKNTANNDVFSGLTEKTELTSSIGQGSQIEGITNINGEKYFLSRERVETTINGNPFILPQKLYRFDNGSYSPLSIEHYTYSKVEIYPNPTSSVLHIKNIDLKSIKSIKIINAVGKTILNSKKNSSQISIKNLTAGLFYLQIQLNNNSILRKKFIKY